ncbi:hypothetical protein Bca101_021045 [Brassica carinata]
MGGDPRVLVATSINPKIVGVHTYFDKETTVGDSYFYRRVAQDTGLSSAAPLLKSYAKVESLSIAELNEFVISASSQAGDGVNPEDTQAPPFVAGMEGRTYTFQVKVGAKTSMQTIKPLRSPASLVKVPLPQFVDNVETGGSSQVQGFSEVKKKARKA